MAPPLRAACRRPQGPFAANTPTSVACCRLAAQALRWHAASADWGSSSSSSSRSSSSSPSTLLAVRDRLVERVGLEDNAQAAAELQHLAQQLARACIEAYCRGHYSALGYAAKGDLPRDWLSELLLAPLLRAACRWAWGRCS